MLKSVTGRLAARAIAYSRLRLADLAFEAADFSKEIACTVTPDQRALLHGLRMAPR